MINGIQFVRSSDGGERWLVFTPLSPALPISPNLHFPIICTQSGDNSKFRPFYSCLAGRREGRAAVMAEGCCRNSLSGGVSSTAQLSVPSQIWTEIHSLVIDTNLIWIHGWYGWLLCPQGSCSSGKMGFLTNFLTFTVSSNTIIDFYSP